MIREEALLRSWDLQKLRTEGIKIESASKGGAEIAGDSPYKLEKYSHKNIKTTLPNHQVSDKTKKKLDCCFCGQTISNLKQHRKMCWLKECVPNAIKRDILPMYVIVYTDWTNMKMVLHLIQKNKHVKLFQIKPTQQSKKSTLLSSYRY